MQKALRQKQIKFCVDAKYSILETIGEGAYGVVCSAVDTTSGARVAIKKICDVFDVPTITKRTLREIKILKFFKHDNVIAIREILRPPEDLESFRDVYVVLDLMGSDLHHIIHSKQNLSEEHVCYFIYQLLRGLKYIHSANIIHRDLKPSNLLVNKDCELKIGDFGMARSLLSSPTEQKRVMTEYVATRWYRAPELMLSVHQFTKAIDLWSVGCILAEMLGRRTLFPGSNYLNQLQLILSVVGLPTTEFMGTITSERIRNYLNKLPHKEAVPLSKMFPAASPKSMDLLTSLLVLDPTKRCSVDKALEHQFVAKYHDLDDEPTCAEFNFDIETLPLDKNILKKHILKEVLDYHSKRPKPKLTPIQTEFPKLFQINGGVKQIGGATGKVVQIPLVKACVDNNHVTTSTTMESRKRKHCKQQQQVVMQKKKPNEDEEELSKEDKSLLERWSTMQKCTKPFIHPIRKHMEELKKDTLPPETTQGQKIVSRISSTSTTSTLKFSNFVPVSCSNGSTELVMEPLVVASSNNMVAVSSAATSHPVSLNLSTPVCMTSGLVTTGVLSTTFSKAKNPPNMPIKNLSQAVLVPVGNIPMYRLQGPANKNSGASYVIIPANNNNAATQQKLNQPIPIAPKPLQLSGINISPNKLNSSEVVQLMNSVMGPGGGDSKKKPIVLRNLHPTAKTRTNKPAKTLNTVAESLKAKSPAASDASGGSSEPLNSSFSAGSNLSELTISSADLNSAVISSGESDEIMSQVRRLNSEEKNIVDLIERIEESNSPPVLESPVSSIPTTLANTNTANWSIVKSMLLRTIETNKIKNQQQQQQKNVNNFTASSSNQPKIVVKLSNASLKTTAPSTTSLVVKLKNAQTNTFPKSNFVSHIQGTIPIQKSSVTATVAKSSNQNTNFLQQNENKSMLFPTNTTNRLPKTDKNTSANNFTRLITNSANDFQNPIQSESFLSMSPAAENSTNVTSSNTITSSSNMASVNFCVTSANSYQPQISINSNSLSNESQSSDPNSDHLLTLLNSVNSDNFILESFSTLMENNSLMTEKTTHKNVKKSNEGENKQSVWPNQQQFDNGSILMTPMLPFAVNNVETELQHNQMLGCNTTKDVFLTTLVKTPRTPRSGAAGYGLGMDFEDLLSAGSFDMLKPLRSGNNGEGTFGEAPLSASLLNEWLGVTSLNPADVADLQRELELTTSALLTDP